MMMRADGPAAAWLPPLASLVGERLGLDYPPERWSDLERGMRAAALQAGAGSADVFAAALLSAPPRQHQLDTLAEALTIGETYFFRERRSFEILEQEILPPLIDARRSAGRQLRLWSAGCCTGEEAYSLAIVVDRLLPRRQEWQVTILGTDVNPAFLRAAARGDFGDWSFRGAPPGFRDRYFTRTAAQRWQLDPRIRQMARFRPLNLVQPGFPDWHTDTQAMDLILCRNVLMYFSPDRMQQVLGRLEHALADGGWLSVSAAEATVKRLHSLTPADFDGAVFYRKARRAGEAEAEAAARPAWQSPVELLPGDRLAQAAASQPQPVPQPVPEPAAIKMATATATTTTTATAVAAAVANADAAPRPPVDLLHLARRQADAGQLPLARATVEHALVVQAKLDAGAHHLHAVILEELGLVAEARAALQRALYLEPDFVLAHHVLGQLALRQGLAAQAQRHFGHVLALLDGLPADAALPRSDGLSAGHLRALVEAASTRRQRA
jgi:chemotaxis protein methyltransferase CheR